MPILLCKPWFIDVRAYVNSNRQLPKSAIQYALIKTSWSTLLEKLSNAGIKLAARWPRIKSRKAAHNEKNRPAVTKLCISLWLFFPYAAPIFCWSIKDKPGSTAVSQINIFPVANHAPYNCNGI